MCTNDNCYYTAYQYIFWGHYEKRVKGIDTSH